MPKTRRPIIKHIIKNEMPEPQKTLFFLRKNNIFANSTKLEHNQKSWRNDTKKLPKNMKKPSKNQCKNEYGKNMDEWCPKAWKMVPKSIPKSPKSHQKTWPKIWLKKNEKIWTHPLTHRPPSHPSLRTSLPPESHERPALDINVQALSVTHPPTHPQILTMVALIVCP